MKRLAYFLPLLLLVSCNSLMKLDFVLPEHYAEADQKTLVKQYKEGQKLYETNCARCHTKVVAGKEVEPDFFPAQMEGYLIRRKPIDHRDALPSATVTDDEIKLVFLYLHNNRGTESKAHKYPPAGHEEEEKEEDDEEQEQP